MKKFYLFIITTLTYGFMQVGLSAQCTNTFQFPSGVIAAPGNSTFSLLISPGSWAGDYFHINELTDNYSYLFTSSNSNDYFTVYDQNNNLITHGLSGISVTSPAGNSAFYVHINSNASCGQESEDRTTRMTCTSCPIDSEGSVSIGHTNPDASAVLDLSNNSKGFLSPKLSASQRDNLASPSNGLIIYNTNTKQLEIYNESISTWEKVGSDQNEINNLSNEVNNLSNSTILENIFIPYEGFRPPANGIEFYNHTGLGRWVINGASLSAPLILPAGSIIQDIIFYHYDNSTTDDCHFSLRRSELLSSDPPVQIGFGVSQNASTLVRQKLFTLNHEVSHYYTYQFLFQNYNNPDLKIKGARVRYSKPVF